MMYLNFPRDRTEKDIYTAGDERPQPSALLDVAQFIIKVDWTEPFPDRWRSKLQQALQRWLCSLEGKPSVHQLKLMDDQSCAEVQITPSTEALKKLKVITLNFKPENKTVTAWICPDEPHSVTGEQNPSMPDKNKISSAKVNSEVPVTSAALNDNVEGVSPAGSGFTVPLYQFWYMDHAYRKELEQIQKQHGVSICSEVSVSIKPVNKSSPDSVSKASDDFQKLVQGCVESFYVAEINHNHMDSDIVKQALHHIQSEETKMMFTMSSSNCLFFGPKKFTDVITREVEGTRMESQFNDSRPTSNDMKHQNFITDRLYLLPEENIVAAGDENQPSALLDVAQFIIKVDWTEPFPDRWRATLQKALQRWLCSLEGKPSVHQLKLMDDQSCAEVQITPSTEALKKLKVITLNFKPENKTVTAWICPDEPHSVTGEQNPSMPDKNKISSAKVNSEVPVTSAALNDNVEGVSPAGSGFTVPLYQFWYMDHAYRKELEQIQKQHGVSICSEVSVSIKPVNKSSPDSVSKASDDFQKLVQGCVESLSVADINHNHMDSDIVKQALHHIQSEETKMLFTMSSSNCLFFGPKKFTDVITREVEGTRMESQFNDSRPTSNDMKHQNFITDRLYLLPEENIVAAGDENQPSAPLDVAQFIIKVDWTEPFPDRWRTTLQKALQRWLSSLEGKPSVHRLKLMDDQSCAEVQITPPTALEVLKKSTPINLMFRDKDGKSKEVTALICLDEAHSVTVPQKSMIKENGTSSTKVISSMPLTSAASEDTNNIEDVAASIRALNEAEISNTAVNTQETAAEFTVPLYQFWYMHHAYRKEIKQIQKQHGVSICAEVSVSVNSTERSSRDSVSKASDDFQELVQGCVDSFRHS